MLGWSDASRFFGEQGAHLFHGRQDMTIASDPREIVGPASTFHVKAAVFFAQFGYHAFQRLTARAFLKPAQIRFCRMGWMAGKSRSRIPSASRYSRYSLTLTAAYRSRRLRA